MNKKLSNECRSELEKLFKTVVHLKQEIDVGSDEYKYYREIRDAIEIVLDRPLPKRK